MLIIECLISFNIAICMNYLIQNRMEAAGLFSLAAELGVQAAAICTVSDHIIKKT